MAQGNLMWRTRRRSSLASRCGRRSAAFLRTPFLPSGYGFRAARSSQGRAPWARRSEPLRARTALKESRQEGKGASFQAFLPTMKPEYPKKEDEPEHTEGDILNEVTKGTF